MSRVYEGIFKGDISTAHDKRFKTKSKLSPPEEKGYVLVSGDGLYNNGSLEVSPGRFYFFDLESGQMYRFCGGHGIQKVRNKSRIDDRTSSKIYLFIDKEWIIITLPSNPLPEISVKSLTLEQKKYHLDVPDNFVLIPLKFSDFRDLHNHSIDVTSVRKNATLAYIAIDPVSCMVTIIYELLVRDKSSSGSFIQLDANYYADSVHGAIVHIIPDAAEITSIESLNNLVAITQQLEDGIQIKFIHAIEGNKNMPENTPLLPRSDFEQLTITSRNTGKQILPLVHPAGRTEIIKVIYTDSSGQEFTQHLILNISSLRDRQYNLSVDAYPKDIKSACIDVSDEILAKLPLTPEAKNNIKTQDVYYLGDKSNYDISDKSKLLVARIRSRENNLAGYTLQRQFFLDNGIPRIYNVFIHVHPERVSIEKLTHSLRKVQKYGAS